MGGDRHGHNEVDEPSFTQPLMYNHIRKTKPMLEKFQQHALENNLLTNEQIESVEQVFISPHLFLMLLWSSAIA